MKYRGITGLHESGQKPLDQNYTLKKSHNVNQLDENREVDKMQYDIKKRWTEEKHLWFCPYLGLGSLCSLYVVTEEMWNIRPENLYHQRERGNPATYCTSALFLCIFISVVIHNYCTSS